ncbi:DUF3021 domain-containing protein [bacterium 1xD8-48]|nr:DUF3021 domain-containing protein [bacterium 1xD8-48]
MKSRFLGWFKRFVSKEIMIEYKSCLYFACILFFYFMWLLCKGIYSASILFMFEMILAAYFVGYFQVYVFRNFDEAEQIEKKGVLGIIFGISVYGAVSYLLGWFEKSPGASLWFSFYMLIVYVCVFLLNKAKRTIDTNNLNKMLSEFKKGEAGERNE